MTAGTIPISVSVLRFTPPNGNKCLFYNCLKTIKFIGDRFIADGYTFFISACFVKFFDIFYRSNADNLSKNCKSIFFNYLNKKPGERRYVKNLYSSGGRHRVAKGLIFRSGNLRDSKLECLSAMSDLRCSKWRSRFRI